MVPSRCGEEISATPAHPSAENTAQWAEKSVLTRKQEATTNGSYSLEIPSPFS